MKKLPQYFCRLCLIVLYAAAIFAAYVSMGALAVRLSIIPATLETFLRSVTALTVLTTMPLAAYSFMRWARGKSMPALYLHFDEDGAHELIVH